MVYFTHMNGWCYGFHVGRQIYQLPWIRHVGMASATVVVHAAEAPNMKAGALSWPDADDSWGRRFRQVGGFDVGFSVTVTGNRQQDGLEISRWAPNTMQFSMEFKYLSGAICRVN